MANYSWTSFLVAIIMLFQTILPSGMTIQSNNDPYSGSQIFTVTQADGSQYGLAYTQQDGLLYSAEVKGEDTRWQQVLAAGLPLTANALNEVGSRVQQDMSTVGLRLLMSAQQVLSTQSGAMLIGAVQQLMNG